MAIRIATEAAAEGINLQFCNVVVNYDLPWNPQPIEQRIGRCHRYGQKFDVVVVNFLNKANAADQRVYELLDEGPACSTASSGPATRCWGRSSRASTSRSASPPSTSAAGRPSRSKFEFDALQRELEEQSSAGQRDAREKLLDSFDGVTDSGAQLDDGQCRRLFDLPGTTSQGCLVPPAATKALDRASGTRRQELLDNLTSRNGHRSDLEMEAGPPGRGPAGLVAPRRRRSGGGPQGRQARRPPGPQPAREGRTAGVDSHPGGSPGRRLAGLRPRLSGDRGAQGRPARRRRPSPGAVGPDGAAVCVTLASRLTRST